jgi:uncharacterized phage infection (PIP) family protein YhgE
MEIKIPSILIILFVSYILGVFLAPTQFDEVAKFVGISEFNTMIRDSKSKLESITSEVKNLNVQTGGILDNAEDQIKRARDMVSGVQEKIETTKDQIDTVKNTLENKVDQGKQIYDTANSLKKQIDTFTTLTGSVTTIDSTASTGTTYTGGKISPANIKLPHVYTP